MSIATEGVEETLFEVTRETRQTSKIFQNVQKDDVVEINLPDELGMNEAGARVLEAIHSIYSADGIGNKLLIKVFFDKDPDRSNAINKVNHCKRFRIGIEYVGIAIPEITRQNPNPGQASTAVVQQNNRPNQPSYGIYCDANGNPPVYFTCTWNNHFNLTCGWRLDFNIVLNEIL
ncbi:hypothetical protein C1645_873350 [Glomus cerebriforme]|uniref:Uncharacterized protein n=1 Tax=Glomus cerebriforme TaxID=658196 RepID=A0A397T8P7_9GLOM|nr:hypothetical protein C1645_873350 [Glomus cerebriforme]